MSYQENIHQEIKLSETIWKDFGKASDFTTVSTEMSMKREGQHIFRTEKLQCKAINANKDAAENGGTNADSNIV